MNLRKLIFWLHLAIGIFVGLFVAYMAATGSILALEPQILRFSEKRMIVPETVERSDCKTVGQKMAAVQQQLHRPVGSMQIDADPRMPNKIQFGKQEIVLVHPCSGEVLHGRASTVRSFLVTVRNLHESASMQHERGALYGLKNAANLGFCFLIVSGLILWIPRQWRKSNLKAITAWRFGLRGRGRDWNLHNVAGFWFAIPLLAVTLTGAIMSYSWAEAILYRISGSPAPLPHGEKHADGGGHQRQLRLGEVSSQVKASKETEALYPEIPLSASVTQPAKASRAIVTPNTGPSQAHLGLPKDEGKHLNDLPSSGKDEQRPEDAGKRESAGEDRAEVDGHPGIEHTRYRRDRPGEDDGEHQGSSDEHKEHGETTSERSVETLGTSIAADHHQTSSFAKVAPISSMKLTKMPAAVPAISVTTTSLEETSEADHPGHEAKVDERKQGGMRRRGEHGDSPSRALTTAELLALDPLIETAKKEKSGWQNVRLRITGNNAQIVSFTFDEGEESEEEGRGRQAELQIDRATGSVLRWTAEESVSIGQRWRRYARYLHTGQVYGLTGQIIALLVSLSALLLVWTGISLSLRRFSAWRARLGRQVLAKKTSKEVTSHL